MSSNQDPAPLTTEGTPRQDWGNVQFRHIQPTLWICGASFVLFVIGVLIIVSAWSWRSVGGVFVMLSLFVAIATPGALLAMDSPWGAFFRLLVMEVWRYSHPRLYGLTIVWTGLVLSGGMGVIFFAPFSPA